MPTQKELLLTGGAGFIGSTLIGNLVAHNKVCVFDNLARDALSRQTVCGPRQAWRRGCPGEC
jgi:UDP-glucose 4-epimerase